MCGITGIMAFNQVGAFYMINLAKSISSLALRGPDDQGSYVDDFTGLGHRRLSVIDPGPGGRQPFKDESERYVLIYNGEIFNYKELRAGLEMNGETFRSQTDTEVLLKLFIKEGPACLDKLVGFFSFAIFDTVDKELFVARDRFGIKPLYYYIDEDKFIFASELKAVMAYNIPRELNIDALALYLHLNYVPSPFSILKNVYKLEPGHFLKVKKRELKKECYYSLSKAVKPSSGDPKKVLASLLEESVKLRLVADVPLGAFLSGGLDSSIIAGIASRHIDVLHTFSIGFAGKQFFDETQYASLAAKHFKTEHTVFSLSQKDFAESINNILDYIDEPFADSSALAVYLLSKKTAGKVKVTLSGDGADEIFGGYNKHKAELLLRKNEKLFSNLKFLLPVLNLIPKSRSGVISNKTRQIKKLLEGAQLKADERYYEWAGFTNNLNRHSLLKEEVLQENNLKDYQAFIKELLSGISETDLNSILHTDLKLVLANDMLTKVDMMSMANGLEVRVPFLDHRVVEYAFSLPSEMKIGKGKGKLILREAFADLLPDKILNRSKKGFDIPILSLLKSDFQNLLEESFDERFLKEQGLFDPDEIFKLKKSLMSSDPGDSQARIWGLVVFQYWFKKYIS